MTRRLVLWAPVVMTMAAIFGVSGIANLRPLPAGISDKLGHFVAYGLLGGLAIRAFAGGRWRATAARAGWQAWLFAAAYGITDELHQRFVPGRTASVGDWVADISGAGVVVLATLAMAAARRRQRREV